MALLQVITSLKITTLNLCLLVQAASTFSSPVLKMTVILEVTTLSQFHHVLTAKSSGAGEENPYLNQAKN